MAGLIERYRDRLPFAPDDPVVSLQEGSTPLVPRRTAERPGRGRGLAEVGGDQPHRLVQGPRDDVRGERGGALGRRDGHLRLDRQHRRLAGRLRGARRHRRRRDRARGQDRRRQARPGAHARRARRRAARQLRRGAEARARAHARHPIALVNSVNPFRLEGQKTAAFEVARGARPSAVDALCIPVGNAGNITAYWKGFREADAAPRMLGFQAAGAAPLVHGAPVEKPETVASAIRIGNPARWEEAMAAMTESRGAIEAVTDDEILAAYRLLAAREGVFCEPASAAVGRRAAQARRRRRVARGLRAHRPRAEGPADRAGAVGLGRAVRARARGGRARRARLNRRQSLAERGSDGLVTAT